MPPSDFANANIDEIVEKLTTEEAIHLIAGVGFWHTHAIDRLGVPAVKVSDGPNGVRGNHFFMSTPAKVLPSSTALGATFDTELVKTVGLKLIAEEAKLRAASLVLAPTCNIQRNPLGGRSFESFSEDPFLSGIIAAAYVNGVQSGGIGTTIKHFTANDKENDRFGYDSIVRTLSSSATSCETNGSSTECDWFGTYGVDQGINAGLDLEMPGTNKWRTLEHVGRCLQAKKVTVRTIKERAKKVLELVQRCAKGAPEVLDGDGEERTLESGEDKELMRKIAAESIVLLKNTDSLLPLNPASLKKIAIVGGNAKAVVLSGGGSAALKSSYFTSPYQGIVDALGGNVEVTYAEGARTYMNLPTLEYDLVTADGRQGWLGTWHSHTEDEGMTPIEEPIADRFIDETRMFISTSTPPGITKRWTLRLKGYLKREYDCKFEFGLTAAGRAKLYVDGNLVVDNWTRQRRGDSFFGTGSVEERGVYELKAGKAHEVYVEFVNVRGPADGDEDETLMDTNPGVRLGGVEVADPDEAMAQAVAIAKEADVVIAVVGLNADWETEGYDRTTLALPGRTDELISKVAAANPRTVVVTQSGSAITMPWANEVPAMVHAWYLGNSTGAAIADVLFGKHNPSGKLSLTFPKREEDIPSFGHFHTENGKIIYSEDLYVGYKHYQHRKIDPLFAFGHGLSYTTFEISNFALSKSSVSGTELTLKASVTVKNAGTVPGSQVVQGYVTLPKTSHLTHPALQLKAFAKVRNLAPGAEEVVELVFDKYAVSYWDENLDRWVVERGVYGVSVGWASDNIAERGEVEIEKGWEWNGL
ncbi:beta-glucosidase [Ephemerocybe angulata]|uniref:beta-glucosidase n=1 Tax=Ephemerocybe angulata TaxID=980116 RepID=A0A8H6I4G2_9AGAR|nr:beta-glucosidase [Tulosesus angulatus]